MVEDASSIKVADSLSSITLMYEQAKRGDGDAANQLWHAYSRRLHGLARAVLRNKGIVPSEASEDSVVNTSFAKFFDALSHGRYQEVKDRHDLWSLLSVMTRNNALNAAKKQGRRLDRVSAPESYVAESADTQPSPDDVAALSDMVDWLLNTISAKSKSEEQADRINKVLMMTLSGFRQTEIAERIGQSEMTVRRNLNLIRDLLNSRAEEDK